MSLMRLLVPASLVLLAWGLAMAVGGVRQRNKLKLLSAAGTFVLLAAGAWALTEFITRPL